MSEEVRYGVDELAAVAALLGAPAFPGVDGVLGSAEAEREAALRSARRSLVARGVLEIDSEGVVSVTAPHALLFSVALAPAAVVTAEHRTADSLDRRSFYLVPDDAVEHSAAIGHVHRLQHFDPAGLLERVISLVELDDGPPGSGEAFETSGEELEIALAAAARGEDVGPPLGEALRSLRSFSRVHTLHRSGGKLVGGELAWIDAGEAGLLLVEPAAEAGHLRVVPVAARVLVAELLSYLPGAEPQPAT